jgi:O-antigen/teichoic acid export membrane protein
VVGSENYGFYFALFNFSLILNILLDLGITNYNNRNIAQHNQLLNKHLSNVIVLKFLLAVVYMFICLAIAFIIDYDAKQIEMLVFLIFNQFLLSFILYLRSNLSGLHLFKTDSFVSVLDRLLMIGICAVLLWGHITTTPFQIEWFVYSQTAAYLVTAVITMFIVLRKAGFLRLHFDRSFFIVFLKQSYPFALLILLMAFYNRIDSVMIERLLPNGKEEAGIYAQSYRILDAASMISFLFAGLLLPIFSKMLKNKEPVEQLVQFSYRLILVPVVIFVVGAVAYSDDLMKFLYHGADLKYSAVIFSVIIPGLIAISTTYIYGTLLTANGKLKYLNIMAASAMLINIILNFILIPRFNALGSAISSLATQSLTAVFQILLANQIFKFKVNWRFVNILLVFVAGVIGVGILVKHTFESWYYGFALIGIVGIMAAFALKLIDLKGIYHIVKNGDEDKS